MVDWNRRDKRAWRHNGLKGCVSMMIRQAKAIQMENTTTEEAKRLASEIEDKLYKLQKALETRVDSP